MKYIFVIIFFTAFSAYAEMTDNFIVTKLRFDSENKIYKIEFKNQAGVYKASRKFLSCLEKSLTTKKEVKVTYDSAELMLSKCESL